jgi:thiamine biosynthesis protein ThiI
MSELIMVRYGEIALKGKNRHFFENVLINNMRIALKEIEAKKIYKTQGRIFVEVADKYESEKAMKLLQKVFGIVSISPVERTPLDLQRMKEKVLAYFRAFYRPGISFKIESRRANKAFPTRSPEINREVGGYILQNIADAKVDVHNPEVKINIEVREDEAYIYSAAFPGSGGLPVSVTGEAILLLSGGIDSPVAAWMGMKRGLKVEALHFYSFPFTSERAKQKVIDLCHVLKNYNHGLKLHIAPFTEIQKQIYQNCPPALGITIMRRMMFRIAQALAKKQKALCILTGESLGQVASQTLESMHVINAITNLPVIRPLVGLDKSEITAISKKIGTYEISIRPYEDCCTIFVPKHPETKPTIEQAEKAEENLDIQTLVDASISGMETLKF